MTDLEFYRLHENVSLPEFATDFSACFDIRAHFEKDEFVEKYDIENEKFSARISRFSRFSEKAFIPLLPFERVKIPTSLIANIPSGCSLRFHSRSGNALKKGIVLANQEAVIDEDYVNEIFIPLINLSNQTFYIYEGDRICQGELHKDTRCSISEISEKPSQKTSRCDGFGHTGMG